ncbi:MAG: flagellar biosynthesis protein FlhB [Chloroflexota bacterium]|jgi:flagellar biosynthetic protein FlhB
MSNKTEAPTPRRLEEARKEGQVARSQELNTAVILLASAFLLGGPGKEMITTFNTLITQSLVKMTQVEISEKILLEMVYSLAVQVLPPLGFILVGLMLSAVVATMGQTRFLWSSKKIGFDFKRVNPLEGFKRIFSLRGLIEIVRALLKLLVVGWVAYSYLRNNLPAVAGLLQSDFRAALSRFADLSIDLMVQVGAVYIILAVADYAYQRWDLMRNLRMTKEEVKEEYKRSEGDPFYKSRIRAQQRRIARNRMMSKVPKAAVVVTNPTHLAIAIEYHEGMNAPRVLAKGALRVAEKIVEIAREHSIPVVQNIPLARAMYKTTEIDQEISADLYLAMAEVLAYVYRLRGRGAGQPSSQPIG